ncbi:MAG: membrane protein insertase YidC [Methylovulum sp.]|uniref:membrane protein insertase YidC n=1 Tax=Methylovulum sp. TaxID=1916980 RepID=UPI0026021A27|nr:membrane protein insertase YidC [Methylovulum sp.]MDD2723270.1 membrane protein insertase YidC [Methylovulum sp.]MDD5126325.1 membrane protein insertase YidC [Methylovulum sp.]
MDNLRFILVVTFAMLVVLLMQAWQIDYGPKPEVSAITTAKQETIKEDLPSSSTTSTTSAAPISPVAIYTQSSKKIIRIKTDVIDLGIDLQGGTIVNLDLLQYPVERDNTIVNQARSLIGLSVSEKNHAPVRLFNNLPEKLFVAQSGLIADNGSGAIANHYTIFNSLQDSYTLSAGQDSLTVPLTWTDNEGITVTKSYTFKRGSYEIALNQHIENASGNALVIGQYSQLLRVPDHSDKGNMLMGGMRAYNGGVVYTEKDKYQKISFDDMVDTNLNVVTKGGWSAMIQHYFASAWIPPADQENHFYTKKLQNETYVIGSYSPMVTVEGNTSADFNSQLFAGPKVQPVMEKVAKGLELTVDYSVLTFIGKPIYWLLNQIHNLTGNWGLAIIGVTLCIKLLFFPLSQASFKSMAKMRKIQPRLKELQERFKDDRQRFNTEMMALYKKEKANPLGGCFPVLVQIPVFMCLYWVLSETVEFRQTPFMLWIQDLSVEDPFYILPIIMGVTMKIQQSLNPVPIDPIQAKVMKMFPLVFTVFFLFFPAGLVLYWVVNNTLSIIQQWYITKQINAEGTVHIGH